MSGVSKTAKTRKRAGIVTTGIGLLHSQAANFAPPRCRPDCNWLKIPMVFRRLTTLFLVFGCFWAPFAPGATLSELTGTPFIADIKISPTGDYLAVRIFVDGRHQLRFLARESFEPVGGISFPEDNEVGDFYWVNDERVVIQVIEFSGAQKAPTYHGELFAADFDSSGGGLIFGYRSADGAAGSDIEEDDTEYAWADIIDPLPEDQDTILIAKSTVARGIRQPAVALPLDAYTGDEGRGIKMSAYPGGRFYVDVDGDIRLATSRGPESSIHAQALPIDARKWMDIPDSVYGDYFAPIAIARDKQSVYALDNVEHDKLGLYKLSLDGASYSNIYTHDDVDITSPIRSTDGRTVYALRIDSGFPSYLVLSNSGPEADVFRSLLQFFSGSTVSIRSQSGDGNFLIVRTGTDVDPGGFYLFDREANVLKKVFNSKPSIEPADLATTEPVGFHSFDGNIVPGYFTAARSSSEQVAPLVVLVHDGPNTRDYWGYDPEVQALATNGFSVLQVNYRGSAGYGRAFEEAGYRHWGDHIQQDIIAGVQWAIDEQLASSGSVCIMGTGFGAYSAVQSAILEPELFNCVVANAGIYDLLLLYSAGDSQSWFGDEAYLERAIGRDDQELERFSPVRRLAELQAPVLIAPGMPGKGAPIDHAERLRKELDRLDRAYTWFQTGREADGFYDNDYQVEYLDTAIAFLNEHLVRPGQD